MKDVEILEAHACVDHIHMLLKYKQGNRNFWAKGYYVSTVGLNEKTVQEYIRNQENEDQLRQYDEAGIRGSLQGIVSKR